MCGLSAIVGGVCEAAREATREVVCVYETRVGGT